MKIRQLHQWNVNIATARSIQLQLRQMLKFQKLAKPVHYIAGADVSYSRKSNLGFAAITIFKYPEMELCEQKAVSMPIKFPYIPGYLTFREAPILLEAFQKLSLLPDLVLFDGQGIAHPRGMGIAAHIGLCLDLPSIGCAKSRLIGEFESPGQNKGDYTPLFYNNQHIGAIVRTRAKVNPVFVSPGHLITIEESVEWVLKTCTKYRIPEPIRESHIFVNQMRQKSI